jgi:RHS repeat-associated protein
VRGRWRFGRSGPVNYSFPDNQNSTNVVTDATSVIQQTLDYYPYGSARISSGSNVQQRKYIGQFSDSSGLDYLNARYLSSDRGQFISEDPVFLGDPKQQNIQDPQSFNTYSYSQNNPITRSDPSGRCGTICVVGSAAYVGAITWDLGADVYSNVKDPSVPWYSTLTPRGDDAALRYNRDAWSSVAVAESALGAEELASAAPGGMISVGGKSSLVRSPQGQQMPRWPG